MKLRPVWTSIFAVVVSKSLKSPVRFRSGFAHHFKVNRPNLRNFLHQHFLPQSFACRKINIALYTGPAAYST